MKVGFYECDVTPPLGLDLNGHFYRRLASGVSDRLYAKAVVFGEGDDIAALMVLDMCDTPPDIRDIVTKRVHEYTGIRKENICVCANHTHTGVLVSDWFCGEKLDFEYLSVLYRLCADAVILAYNRMTECEGYFGIEKIENLATNRNYILPDGTLQTWTRERNGAKSVGITDPDVSVLFFESNGVKKGAVVNFAAHQDSLDKQEATCYSGDYSSIIAKKLKEKYGPDFVSVFVIGACGNIGFAPYDPDAKVPHHREIGVRIFEGVEKAIEKSKKIISSGIGVKLERLMVPKRQVDKEELSKKIMSWIKTDAKVFRVKGIVDAAFANDTSDGELIVQGIRIGNVFLYCLPGEMYVEYGLYLKEKSPFEHNIIIELCNCHCGYIPTIESFSDNSDLYEASLSPRNCYIPQAGNMICDTALKISNELNNR